MIGILTIRNLFCRLALMGVVMSIPAQIVAGTIDAKWTAMGGTNFFTYGMINSRAMDSAGAIYLSAKLGWAKSILKWDGKKWDSIAPGIDLNEILDIEFDKTGNLYAVGEFKKNFGNGIIINSIAMWDGHKWNPLGNLTTTDVLLQLEIGKDGRLYVLSQGSNDILRSDSTGWKKLGTANDTITGFKLDNNDNLYVAGSFDSIGNIAVTNVARWNGIVWENIGRLEMSDNSPANADWLLNDRRGKIYVAGKFDRVDSKPIANLACWNGTEWCALGKGIGNNNLECECQATIGPTGDLYLSGELHDVDTLGDQYVVRWDGTRWHSLTMGLISSPHLIAVDKSSTVYTTYHGWFQDEPWIDYSKRWFRNSGNGWEDVCSEMGFNFNVFSTIYDRDGNLYVGGDFTLIGGEEIDHIAKWDGTSWSKLGDSLKLYVEALAFDSSGILYAGGGYALNDENTGVMKWNGTSWTSLNNNSAEGDLFKLTRVHTLQVDKNGLLYAGGTTNAGAGLMVWNGSSWKELGGAITGNAINAITFDKIGDLYIAGGFNRIGSVVAQNIARWDGATWNALGEGIQKEPNFLTPVRALAFDSKGFLYAGGGFKYAGKVKSRNIAKWNGSEWTVMETQNDNFRDMGVINCILVDKCDHLYVGGSFDSIDVINAKSIAVWDGTSWNKIAGGMEGPGAQITDVYGMALRNNTLAVGGSFSHVSGKISKNFALCDLKGFAAFTNNIAQKSAQQFHYNKMTGVLKLSLTSTTKVQTMIYTLSGREICRKSQILLTGAHTVRPEIDRLPGGTYIVQVNVGRESFQHRLVVQR